MSTSTRFSVSIDLQIRPICTVHLNAAFLLWPSNNCSHNFTVLPSYVLLLWLVVTVEMLLQVELMMVASMTKWKRLETLSNNLHCVVSGKKEGSKLQTIVLLAWVLLRINQSNSRCANEYLWPPVGSWKPTNCCSKRIHILDSYWWFQASWKILIRQIGSFPQVRAKINKCLKHVWNHLVDFFATLVFFFFAAFQLSCSITIKGQTTPAKKLMDILWEILGPPEKGLDILLMVQKSCKPTSWGW